MNFFSNTDPMDKVSINLAFDSGDAERICNALVAMTHHEKDWAWAQDKCLRLLENSGSRISGLAATCLGNIARIHRRLDKDRVIGALLERSISCPEIRGMVEDALDDISIFLLYCPNDLGT